MRNKKYLEWIKTKPCVVSQQQAEPCHVRDKSKTHMLFHGGMSMKPADELCLPFARHIHRLEHDKGINYIEDTFHIDYAIEIQKYNILYIRKQDVKIKELEGIIKALEKK